MELSTIMNVVLLHLLNISFMVAGIFLNSVVIISIWRSSQLRKKSSYFLILVLSCFDLAAVVVTHPLLTLLTILWSMDIYPEEIRFTWIYTSVLFGGFSLFALLTLNIERYLGVMFPIFHRTSVTKKRLLYFLVFLNTLLVALLPLHYFYWDTVGDILTVVVLLLFFITFVYLHCKTLGIARSESEVKKLNQSTEGTASHEQRNKIQIIFKNISSCSLALGCFSICSFPEIINSICHLTSSNSWNAKETLLFNIWASTLFAMNSTFNCLIFFWKNLILRREGMKIVKCFLNK